MKRIKRKTQVDLASLRDAQAQGRFAEFLLRGSAGDSVTGYLLECTPECLLIEQLNWDCFVWDGLCLLWRREITKVRIFDEHDWPILAAKRLRLARPVSFKVSEEHSPEFLKRCIPKSELFELEQGRLHPDMLFLCQVQQIANRHVRVTSFGRDLVEAQEITIPFREVTKITFQDGYSKAAQAALSELRRLHILT